ncbi:Acetyltransferase (GNAT) family protein [Paenibacillus sp. CF384]|nr:Acetyltransferase (GNAT) family protein [Paenibacillus sp. CF384]
MLAPSTNEDREWMKELWVNEFGGETVISKGKEHHLRDVEALIAWMDGERVGAATYRLSESDDYCELTGINAVIKGSGIGSELLAVVEQIAKQAGLKHIWLITTNDNVDALRFYQRLGYRIVAFHPNAVDEARKRKPAIPLIGFYGIPLRDEIELQKLL